MPEYTDEQKEADDKWFAEHQESLYSSFGKCYLGIRNQQIVAFFNGEKYSFVQAQDNLKNKNCTLKFCNAKS